MFGTAGMLGIDGLLGTLGMLAPGMAGISRVDLFTTRKPTTPAMAMNTTAPMLNTSHGMPADDFRGGGAHGVPYPGGGYGPCACGGIDGNGGGVGLVGCGVGRRGAQLGRPRVVGERLLERPDPCLGVVLRLHAQMVPH